MTPAEMGLFTDLYELTMMQGYWAKGRQAEWACFELYFRTVPEGGAYCIAAGIQDAIDIAEQIRFTGEHVAYLQTLNLFDPKFLTYLRELRFTGEMRAVHEGSLIFPHEPILEVCGPIIEAQWLETALLNCVNFQTLLATKASRVARAARPAKAIEFGMRRAQGYTAALWGVRAAYLGGCVGTSNLEAGRLYQIPVFGTHAHSWVMSFDTEQEAFAAYADVFPDHTIFLIDTYDTLESGLVHAIAEAKRLQAAGHRAVGVRLDSGDLAELAIECRKRLNAEGLDYVQIVATGDLDEYVIAELKTRGAPIDVFGVGTRLATAYSEPALNGVYKLCALVKDNVWMPKLKLAANSPKKTIPGRKQIYRGASDGRYVGDLLTAIDEQPTRPPVAGVHAKDPKMEALLMPVVVNGRRVGLAETLPQCRDRVFAELEKLPAEHQRLNEPQPYEVTVSRTLVKLSEQLATT